MKEKSLSNAPFVIPVFHSKEHFKCNICFTCFSLKGTLEGHNAAIHKGEKPFKCTICDTSFSLKAKLKRHNAAIHRKNKAF